ncbi:16553_t:CDS:2 [Cetraspora pellucida]|uniref:16553_t:CDS:1 n=1 Tax=Cetraspora pellucida TaxID=1433469 RepID=A0ACA9KQA1_9GLOM|nr:16553_t:CDS:2 [Cetraspora pellucida]
MSLYEEPLVKKDQSAFPYNSQNESVVISTGFMNNLNRLTLDTLRMLCKAKELSVSGSKKDLTERLTAKTAVKLREKESEKKAMKDNMRSEVCRKGLNEEQHKIYYNIGAEKFMLESQRGKLLQAMLTKALADLKQTLHVHKIGKELDEALYTKFLKLIVKVQKLAYIQAYTLQVVNIKGWDIASAFRDLVSEDPIEVALREKLVLARQLAKNKKRKLDYSSLILPSMQQPQCNIVSLLCTKPALCGLDALTYAWKSKRLKNIICYVYEKRGHITTNCPYKKSGCPFGSWTTSQKADYTQDEVEETEQKLLEMELRREAELKR